MQLIVATFLGPEVRWTVLFGAKAGKPNICLIAWFCELWLLCLSLFFQDDFGASWVLATTSGLLEMLAGKVHGRSAFHLKDLHPIPSQSGSHAVVLPDAEHCGDDSCRWLSGRGRTCDHVRINRAWRIFQVPLVIWNRHKPQATRLRPWSLQVTAMDSNAVACFWWCQSPK